MSRIGNKPVALPSGVEVIVAANNAVTVKGPKGELSRTFNSNLGIQVEGNEVIITRPNDEKQIKMIHGTTRALLNNMVVGVSEGFTRELEIIGVGYRAQKQGEKLVISAGYSHPVEMFAPEGVTVEVPTQTSVIVKGTDKQVVGEFAANIRAVRSPEPYKGKGIRYKGEFVRRKEGKKAKK
ncbi:MAG: 50S ribosomal protein L6 [Turicibacter sp.]|nr:50S ribosomal protein L6 [Turicibacter sp.]